MSLVGWNSFSSSCLVNLFLFILSAHSSSLSWLAAGDSCLSLPWVCKGNTLWFLFLLLIIIQHFPSCFLFLLLHSLHYSFLETSSEQIACKSCKACNLWCLFFHFLWKWEELAWLWTMVSGVIILPWNLCDDSLQKQRNHPSYWSRNRLASHLLPFLDMTGQSLSNKTSIDTPSLIHVRRTSSTKLQ